MTGYTNLHRFAVGTAACTFLLIIAGGLVTSTGSGLSVPDWPNTYGRFMLAFPLDQMVGGIVFEHTHRLIASAVGFLTVLLAIWLWMREDRRWVRNLGWAAVGLVVAQGLLGGLTVLLLLPPAVSVGHAMLAQTFFVVVASLALFTSPWWRTNQPQPSAHHRSIVRLGALATIAVFFQLMLGALMRHTDSGLAVPDFPLAYGQLLPSLSSEAIARYNDILLQSGIRIAADGPITVSQIVIHLIHRAWALPVFLLVVWTSVRLMKLSALSSRFPRLGWFVGTLVTLQIGLGAMTVLTGKAIIPATAHVAIGALLLVILALATLHGVRLWGLPRVRILHSTTAQSACEGAA